MSDWDNLQFVLAVQRCGSIGAASRAMRLNYSTVHRRLGAYEEALGVKLFERSATGQVCTRAGLRICDAAERMEEELIDAERAVAGNDASLEGELRVTMPGSLFHALLAPVLGAFSERYNEIRLSLSLTSDISDLSKREADIAFRFSNNPPESLVGSRITNCAQCIYASPAYVVAHPAPDSRRWIGGNDRSRHPSWVKNSTEPSAGIRHNALDNMAKVQMAAHGMGMALLPCFLGDQDSRLVRVPAAHAIPGRDLWILTHEDMRKTARVRALLNHTRTSMKTMTSLLEGRLPTDGHS